MQVKGQRKQIIFIHGKNPKPPAEQHRELLWRCLLRGVARAAPKVAAKMSNQADSFTLIPWSYLYYHRYRDVSIDIPWIERLIEKEAPSDLDRKELARWRLKFTWLLYNMIARFPSLINLAPDPAVRTTIKETRHYFENHNGIAVRIRELLKSPLRKMFHTGDRILVIGHSMGSIIGYDALWEMWHEEENPGRVSLFLSLGSPLGLRYTQQRLLGSKEHGRRRYPGNILRWINITAKRDLTALDTTLSDDFKDMVENGLTDAIEDRRIITFFRNEKGLNPHRSYGYLVNNVVGEVIADWWRDR